MTDKIALDLIAEILSGKEWDSGTASDIAEIVSQTGRILDSATEDWARDV